VPVLPLDRQRLLDRGGGGDGTPPWFQLYMLKDRGFMRELLARAKAAGLPVLVFTVDLPLPGSRYRDIRSGFTGATPLQTVLTQAEGGPAAPGLDVGRVRARPAPHPGQVQAAVKEGKRVTDFLAWISRNFDRSVTWKDIGLGARELDGPIVLKGVLDLEDAREAVKVGAQGIVVSNHGGRQLDGVKSSVAALPRIADAVGGDLEVYMGRRRPLGPGCAEGAGAGAKACFVGRPWAWALGAGGETQVGQDAGHPARRTGGGDDPHRLPMSVRSRAGRCWTALKSPFARAEFTIARILLCSAKPLLRWCCNPLGMRRTGMRE
jgi:L-lactate dehydrogenase (cytochrome)